LTQPELVLEATLNQATLRGLNLPPDAPPPTLYIAIRNGQLIVRGSAAGVLTVDGNGSVAEDGTLSGLVQIKVTDIAKAVALSPKTASLPAAGNLTANLQLGGKLTSIETLRIDATSPNSTSAFPSMPCARAAAAAQPARRPYRLSMTSSCRSARPAPRRSSSAASPSSPARSGSTSICTARSEAALRSPSSLTCVPTATSPSPAR
jgi:hypothetical protein